MNVLVCELPIRVVPESPATPWFAMSTLLLSLVRLLPAWYPKAVLLSPVAFASALTPTAVFWVPVRLL